MFKKLHVSIHFFLLFFLCYFSTTKQIKAQDIYSGFEKIKDTMYFKQINDSVKIWNLLSKPEKVILQRNKQTTVFVKDTILKPWRINAFSDVWQIDKIYQLWKNSDSVMIWVIRNQQWVYSKNAKFRTIYDSLKLWVIDDSICLMQRGIKQNVWKYSSSYRSHSLKKKESRIYISDTIQIFNIDKKIKILHNPHASIWNLDEDPVLWKISDVTKIWSIAGNLELWQANNKFRFYRVNISKNKWTRVDTIPRWNIKDSLKIYQMNQKLQIWIFKDSVQFWRKSEKNVFHLADSLHIWQIPKTLIPMPKPDSAKDSIRYNIRFWQVNDEVKTWQLNDSVKYWKIGHYNELWKRQDPTQFWFINDTTRIYNIGDKIKISLFNDSVSVWNLNDSTGEWVSSPRQDILYLHGTSEKAKQLRIFSYKIIKANDSLKVSIFGDTVSIWKVFRFVEMTVLKKKKSAKFIQYQDSLRIWNFSDTMKIWIEKMKHPGLLIRENHDVRKSVMKINDSTKIWLLNPNIRITLVNDSATFWRNNRTAHGNYWMINKGIKSLNISDTLKIWRIEDFFIWQNSNGLRFFTPDPKGEVWNLGDTAKLFLYSPNPKQKPKKKPKYWSFKANGSLQWSQLYLDNWIKGGENSFSLLQIFKTSLLYNRKNTQWENYAELKLGFLNAEYKEFRKNEDLIEVSSKFGQKAFQKWYYSLSSNIKTQAFKGFDYKKNDSVRVSNFLSPLFFVLGFGLDYIPNKHISIFISPITSKTTYIRDSAIDETAFGLKKNQHVRKEHGAFIKSSIQFELSENISIDSKLDFFTDYNDHFQEIDINLEVNLVFKVNKYINTNININTIYDHDVLVPFIDKTTHEKTGEGPRTQFKELFSIGLTLQI